jgi:hypothetical protein
MARTAENKSLQVIFSFFLGLMVLAFIGIGVNTFYPSPQTRNQSELDKLYRQQEPLNMKQGTRSLTATEQAEYDRIQTQIDDLMTEQDELLSRWARNTSIVLVLFATAVMAVSLVRSEQLRVVSNGLLMGGLFTMLYGSGWVLVSEKSIARFFVVLFALVVALALGYLKFVRGREDRAPGAIPSLAGAPGAVTLADNEAMANILVRLDRLEARTAAAAAALGAVDQVGGMGGAGGSDGETPPTES